METHTVFTLYNINIAVVGNPLLSERDGNLNYHNKKHLAITH